MTQVSNTVGLHARGIDPTIRDRIHAAAAARGMTTAAYLTALLLLHDAIRARADAGDDALQADLKSLGLETVER